MTFKERFADYQHLVREHALLRTHNLSFKEGDPQRNLLLFAEGALVIIMLERFLRIVPAIEATDGDSLYNLLDKATSKSRKVLEISQAHREGMLKIRNAILHGNFEKAATEAVCANKEEYFKTQYASEIESFYRILDGLVDQIDPITGNRKVPLL